MKIRNTLLCILICLVCLPLQAAHNPEEFKDITWAKPRGFELTADIYVPDTDRKNLPVLIIYHGGGWLLNTKSIMTDMARYMVSHSDLVVVNTNYRRLADLDNTTTMNEIVEDALGAVLWVKDNIARYNGDPEKIAVTGDSAGGHLAAMVTLAGRRLESDGFKGKTLGFNPTYLPSGKTAEQVAKEDGAAVQAAILSYAGFNLSASAKNGFETDSNPFWGWAKAHPRGMFGKGISVENHPEFYEAVSPINYIVDRKDYRLPPQFVLVGEHDNLVKPEVVANYVSLLKKAGQPVEMKVYKNRGHGFLDSGCNDYTQGCFKDLAVPTLNDMIKFLNKVFDTPQTDS
jgi:acetyl esterase/lipase